MGKKINVGKVQPLLTYHKPLLLLPWFIIIINLGLLLSEGPFVYEMCMFIWNVYIQMSTLRGLQCNNEFNPHWVSHHWWLVLQVGVWNIHTWKYQNFGVQWCGTYLWDYLYFFNERTQFAALCQTRVRLVNS